MNVTHPTPNQAQAALACANREDVALASAGSSVDSGTKTPSNQQAADDSQQAELQQTTRQKLTHGFLAMLDQGFVSLNTFLTLILVAKLGGQSAVNLYVLAWSLLNVARITQERMIGAPYVVFAHQETRDLFG